MTDCGYTLRYFEVLWGSLKYFVVLCSTLTYLTIPGHAVYIYRRAQGSECVLFHE